MNIPKLKGRVVEAEMTMAELADAMSIDRNTLTRRLANDGNDFTLGEIKKMQEVLHLAMPEVESIFFV
ncbi:MAG: helix-turn-helix transcriptional regulator [Saccharofermentans sp.]|nr:helix-turn-helix transcriptional regulator [Saccharofermentans sp.]